MSYFEKRDLPSVEMLPGIRRQAVWLSNVMVTYFAFEPGSVVPQHRHPHEQITIVTKGALRFTLDGETRILRSGDGVSIPSNVLHSAITLGEATEAIDAWSPLREDYRT